jgi:hypothetical protein
MTTPTLAELAPGDVIQDSYGNPAVVLSIGHRVGPNSVTVSIMQTCGSDRGRFATRTFRTDKADPWFAAYDREDPRVEAARDIARDQWRAGKRW